ncbi:hypothetical protein [Soonwooa purpurea]
MKKYIPLFVFTISIIGLKSCRDQNDILAPTETKSQEKNTNYMKRDSLDIDKNSKENDPDPPVKDGQDWRSNTAPTKAN